MTVAGPSVEGEPDAESEEGVFKEEAASASDAEGDAGSAALVSSAVLDRRSGCSVTTAEGSTEMRSPGCNRILGSETCDGSPRVLGSRQRRHLPLPVHPAKRPTFAPLRRTLP